MLPALQVRIPRSVQLSRPSNPYRPASNTPRRMSVVSWARNVGLRLNLAGPKAPLFFGRFLNSSTYVA